MATFTLKCPRCGKTSKIKRCANCGAGSGALFFDRYADNSIRGVACKKCGMQGHAIVHPQPNEIDIGGEIVALDCREKED